MPSLYNRRTKHFVSYKGSENLSDGDLQELKEILIDDRGYAPEELLEVPRNSLEDIVKQRGAQSKEEMDKQILEAREAELPSAYKLIAPSSSREILAGEDSPVLGTSTLKDAFSLPGRFLSATGEFLSTAGESDFSSMEKPSEEREGFLSQLATSPVVGATVLSLPVAGASAPMIAKALPKVLQGIWTAPVVEGVIDAGVAVGSGLSMDPKYGGSDVALDAVTSAFPAAGPIFKAWGKTRSLEAIEKVLKEKGIPYAPEDLTLIYEKTKFPKSTKKFGASLREEGLSDITKNLKGKDIGKYKFIPEASFSESRPTSLDRALENVKASLYDGFRTGDEASRDIAKIEDFKRGQALLEEGKAVLTPEAYEKGMSTLIEKYGDVPELLEEVQAYIDPKMSIYRTNTDPLSVDMYGSDFAGEKPSQWTDAYKKARMGSAIEEGIQKSKFPKKVKGLVVKTAPVLAPAATPLFPYVQRRISSEDEESDMQPLSDLSYDPGY